MDERMIARQDAYIEKTDVWAKLSAPVPSGAISWRQDGKVTARDGKYFARFVAYIEANTVRERLDTVVPGEWDLTLELMPPIAGEDGEGTQCSFKARLQILGVIREDVGTGRDYKQASTDAFKRGAVRNSARALCVRAELGRDGRRRQVREARRRSTGCVHPQIR